MKNNNLKNCERTKKTTKIFSAALLCIMCCVCVFSVCLFGGCGNKNVSIATLKETFAKLDQQNAQLAQSGIFSLQQLGENTTQYVITYRETDNKIIEDFVTEDENFRELRELFNKLFAETNAYLDQTSQARNFVLAFETKPLSEQAHEAINSLNAQLLDYLAFVPKFVQQRKGFMEHAKIFSQQSGFGPEMEYTNLRAFKRNALAPLVQKNLNAANALANAVEKTQIFETLQGEIKPEDFNTLAKFVQIKLLPLYSRLRLEEISSQMFWQQFSSQQHSGQTFEDTANLLKTAEQQYNKILRGFQVDTSGERTADQIERVVNLVNLLMQDAKQYYAALDGINLQEYAEFDGTTKDYLAKNPYADVHLKTLQTFWSYTVQVFLDTVDALL